MLPYLDLEKFGTIQISEEPTTNFVTASKRQMARVLEKQYSQAQRFLDLVPGRNEPSTTKF